jgi:cysteinyl-tRNA synthetase
MHNGLLNLRGQKMSKSTGHFFAMEDVLGEFDGQVVRFYLLSTHFRSQMEYSRERLENARKAFERLTNACRSIDELRSRLGEGPSVTTPAGKQLKDAAEAARTHFLASMDDDFNSAAALGYLFELIKTYNVLLDENGPAVASSREGLEAVWAALSEFDRILGLFRDGLPRSSEEIPAEILAAVEERVNAKKNKDFRKADEIRDHLLAAGYLIEDTPAGARVRRK